MHRIFHPLSYQSVSFLLTLLTQGGTQELFLLQYLPADIQAAIQVKAEMLTQIPSDKRALFIAHELKNILSEDQGQGIEAIHPSWILDALQKEQSHTIAAIMLGFSPSLLRGVVENMPLELRKQLPSKDSIKHIQPAIIKIVQQQFEKNFAPMPPANGTKQFAFRDLIHLEVNELMLLIRANGLDELAQAFSNVGKYALAELCKRVPHAFAVELVEAVKLTQAQYSMETKTAQRFLAHILVDFKDTEELCRNGGLYRLARSLGLEDRDFKRAFFQRMPRLLAIQLEQYILKAQELGEIEIERARKTQDILLKRLYQLVQNKAISGRYLDYVFQFHGSING